MRGRPCLWLKVLSILGLVGAFYLLVYYFTAYAGLTYLFYPLIITCWVALALVSLVLGKRAGVNLFKWRLSMDMIYIGFFIAAVQVCTYFLLGFMSNFGNSPYAVNLFSIVIYAFYFISIALATELSRTLLLTSFSRKNVFLGFVISTIFFTIVSISPLQLLSLNSSNAVQTFGQYVIPAFGSSLLATGLVIFGGPLASLAYLLIVQGFNWLSPILPNLAWPVVSLVTTIIPVVGIIVVFSAVQPYRLVRLGFAKRLEVIGRPKKSQNSSYFWLAVIIVITLFAWAQTGVFGVASAVEVTGSMTPAIHVGDIVVTVQTPATQIHIGDIVEYSTPDLPGPVTHRVVQISTNQAGELTFTTKGDANNAADPSIVAPSTIGKVVLIIPKVGWGTIYLDEGLSTAFSFLTSNLLASAALLIGLISAAIAGAYIHGHRTERRFRKIKS